MHRSINKARTLALAVALVLASPLLLANPENAADPLQSAGTTVQSAGSTAKQDHYDFELTIVHGVDGAREQTIIRRKMQYADYVAEYGPFTPDPSRYFDSIEAVVPTPDPPVGGTGFGEGDTLNMTRTGNDGERHYTRRTRYERRAGDWWRMSNNVTSRMRTPPNLSDDSPAVISPTE